MPPSEKDAGPARQRAVVAVDLGTTTSGVAFALDSLGDGAPRKYLEHGWPAQPAPYPKTLS